MKLTIQEYKPRNFAAFAGARFVGWILNKGVTMEVRPANGWRVLEVANMNKARRYLIKCAEYKKLGA